MIDRDGYRPNVAIVLCNAKNEVFWGKRIKEHAWQFPQGGIKMGGSPKTPCSGNWKRKRAYVGNTSG